MLSAIFLTFTVPSATPRGDEQEEESGELGAPITELPKKSNSIKAFMFVLVITPSSTLG